jgi:hypothetical protein
MRWWARRGRRQQLGSGQGEHGAGAAMVSLELHHVEAKGKDLGHSGKEKEGEGGVRLGACGGREREMRNWPVGRTGSGIQRQRGRRKGGRVTGGPAQGGTNWQVEEGENADRWAAGFK